MIEWKRVDKNNPPAGNLLFEWDRNVYDGWCIDGMKDEEGYPIWEQDEGASPMGGVRWYAEINLPEDTPQVEITEVGDSPSIKEMQEITTSSAQRAGLFNITMERRMLHLTSEVGELAKDILRAGDIYDTAPEEVRKNLIGAEMSDVVWNVMVLASSLGIDLQAAMVSKVAHLDERWKRIIRT